MKILKVISGGQTGADRGGIDAAITLGVLYGGKIPAGRRAEDGIVPEQYQDLEVVPKRKYLARTEYNVEDSDLTLIFTPGVARSGSKRTIEFAIKHNKPYLHINLSLFDYNFGIAATYVIEWLRTQDLNDAVINVAGSRESTFKGIHDIVYHTMVEVLYHFRG